MNLTSRLKNILHTHPEKKILGYKKNNQWNWVTREELRNKICYCIDLLHYSGLSKNDRVMFKGNNSVNWVAWNAAVNSLGGIFVPLYNNQNNEYVKHIIDDCEPTFFVTNDTEFNNVTILRDVIEDSKYNMDIPTVENNKKISKLIYTSGTTGKPKGVMITHENILANIFNLESIFHDLQNEKEYTTLNILPWAHIYGLTTELYYNMLNNNKIAISSGPQEFVKELREIRPDLLYIVPRVLVAIKARLEMFDKPVIRLLLPIVIKKLFGGNLLTIFVGGSQLDETTKRFYETYNVSICEGYGCTETSPMVSVNHIYSPRNTDSVGKILDSVVVEIINNEICVSGPSVMKGYWNNVKATNNVIIPYKDRYFYKTGDEGEIKDGFLFYKGRISENYKLSNGKFVNIGEIENTIKEHISQAFIVYGNNKDYNIIICEEDCKITDELLSKINNSLDSYLRIKKILYLENGTFQKYMTPKMSIKRKEIEKDYKIKIEKMYQSQ
jgi:long-chain acyl-CoA synthetase